MHKFIDKIKKNEAKPSIIKNFINNKEIEKFQKLYFKLPVEINNRRQNIIKKKWSSNFFPDLQQLYKDKLRSVLKDYLMDNPKTKDGLESLGLFQESFKPVSLHVDSGFDFNKIIYKQTLLPLSEKGETVIFKNRFYGKSTNFTIDKNELELTKLNYGQNIRSNKHIGMFGNKPFSIEDHKKYLEHEKIENLIGLEIELVYEWELGSMLIFDRTSLHCSSSKIEGKKIGLTTFTKK